MTTTLAVFAFASAAADPLDAGPRWEAGALAGAAGACGLGPLLGGLALCSPSDPTVGVVGRHRPIGPLRLGVDVAVVHHSPSFAREIDEAVARDEIGPPDAIAATVVPHLAVAPTFGQYVELGPLLVVGPGLAVMRRVPEPFGPGGTRLMPTGNVGVGARYEQGRVAVEAELRHALGLALLERGTVELEPVGAARVAVLVGL
jgi:hypothetical protein